MKYYDIKQVSPIINKHFRHFYDQRSIVYIIFAKTGETGEKRQTVFHKSALNCLKNASNDKYLIIDKHTQILTTTLRFLQELFAQLER